MIGLLRHEQVPIFAKQSADRRKMFADTIGFSRMEIQFQPILERNSPKLNLRRLKHSGIQTEKFAPGK